MGAVCAVSVLLLIRNAGRPHDPADLYVNRVRAERAAGEAPAAKDR